MISQIKYMIIVLAMMGCGASNTSQPKTATAIPAEVRIRDCNLLVDIINKSVDAVTALSNENSADPLGDLTHMAESLSAASSSAGALKLEVPELARLSKDYEGMLADTAKAARDMVVAIEAKDPSKIGLAQAALDRAVLAEDKIVDNVNKTCQ